MTAAKFAVVASTRDVVDTYLDAWKTKNADAIAACVHPDVHFTGPMTELRGRDAFVEGARKMFPLLQEYRVRAVLTNGNQAVCVYDFVCREPVGVSRTAELITLKDGRVASSEIFFDARPFEKLIGTQKPPSTSAEKP